MSAHRLINLTFLCFGVLVAAVVALGFLRPATETTAALTEPLPIVQLTHVPGNSLRPQWSPDNRSIAFESNRDGAFHIYVMNADGSHLRPLTTGSNDDRRPVWTPDGKSILYDSSDGTRQDIWSVNVANGNRRQLTHEDGLADFATLSPDGSELVFYLYQDMTLNLWSARADGSAAKPLTRDLADARREQPTTAWHQAGWSPDSQWLTFTGGDGKSIWIMRANGSDTREIINDGETNHFPWFLTDGRLAFITEYVPPKYGAAWTNAWVLDLQTGERTLMQESMSMQGPVAWSADNSKILFSSPRGGRFDIYQVDLNVPGGLEALRGKPVPAEIAEKK